MLERKHISSVFTDQFFKAITLDKTTIVENIPIPQSRTELEKFLASAESERSRQAANNAINSLENWAYTNHINSSIAVNAIAILREKFNFKFYKHGQTLNDETYALCTEGIFYLYGIINLLQSADLHVEFKIEKIKTLFTNITAFICGAGVHIHLGHCYHQLRRDTASLLMEIRRQIATNIVLESIIKFNAEGGSFIVEPGEEIHHAIAVLNENADELGLVKITDPRIPPSTKPEVKRLITDFPPNFYKIFTLERVIQEIVDQAQPAAITQKIAVLEALSDSKEPDTKKQIQIGNELQNAILNYEFVLSNCGDKTFKVHDIFDQDELAEMRYTLTIDINAMSYISILLPPAKKGFFDLNQQHIVLYNEDKLSYVKNESLKFAFVTKNSANIPFIPYFIEHLLKGDEQALAVFKGEAGYQEELAIALCNHLRITKNINCLELLNKFPFIAKFINQYCPLIHIIDLANDGRMKWSLLALLGINPNLIITNIDNAMILGKAVQLFNDYHEFFNQIGINKLVDILKNNGLVIALQQIPEHLRNVFLDSVYKVAPSSLVLSLVQSHITLFELINMLPENSILPKPICTYLEMETDSVDKIQVALKRLSLKAIHTYFKNLPQYLLHVKLTNFDEFCFLVTLNPITKKYLDADKIGILINNLNDYHLRLIFTAESTKLLFFILNQSSAEILFTKLGSKYLQNLYTEERFVSLLKSVISPDWNRNKSKYLAIAKSLFFALTPEYLRHISNVNTISDCFYSLPIELSVLFVEQLGKDFLQKCYRNEMSWLIILRPLRYYLVDKSYPQYVINLLKTLGVEALYRFFPNVTSLAKGLRHWAAQTHKVDPSMSVENLIAVFDSSYLFSVLTKGKFLTNLAVLCKAYRPIILKRMHPEELNTLIPDIATLKGTLKLLDKGKVDLISQFDDKHLRVLVVSKDHFKVILECIPQKSRIQAFRILIEKLGDEYLKQFNLQNLNVLDGVLCKKNLSQAREILANMLNTNVSAKRSSEEYEDSSRFFKKQKSENTIENIPAGKEEIKMTTFI